MTSTTDRQHAILRRVAASGYASCSALADELGVSEMTIRRDVTRLAADGLVTRVHGGAARPGLPFATRAGERRELKRRIAATAAAHLGEATVIGLDAGTTVSPIVDHLPRTGLTVVSHSVPVIAACAEREDLTLIGLGGLYHDATRAFSGPATRAAIDAVALDVLILAATGVTATEIYCSTPFDAETKQHLIARASTVVLVADPTKFGRAAAVRVAGLDAAHRIVTGTSADRTVREAAAGLGIAVDLVAEP